MKNKGLPRMLWPDLCAQAYPMLILCAVYIELIKFKQSLSVKNG